MPRLILPGGYPNQPQGVVPQLKPEFAGARFIYLPSFSLLHEATRPITVTAGTAPTLGHIRNSLTAHLTDTELSVSGTQGLDFTTGMTVLAVGSYFTTVGTEIHDLISRDTASAAGGFELDLYNQYAPTKGSISSSYNKPGVGDTNWDSAWINGTKDLGNGNGAGSVRYNTAINTRYAVAVTTKTGPGASGSTDIDIGRVAGNGSSVDVELLVIWPRGFDERQMWRISADPNYIWQAPRRTLFVEIAGGATAVNPGAGSLVITGYAPAVVRTANQAVAPGVGALTLTGYAPTVVQNANVAPGAGSLAITGYAPSIAQPLAVAPGVGTLTITGYAPSIAQPKAVAPGAGSITITGYAPTVTQQAGQSVNPGAGSVAITGYAPTVAQTANQAVAPGVGSVVITGFAPTVTQASGSNAVTPGVGLITITGYAPTVAQSQPAAADSGGGGGGGGGAGRKKRRKGEKGPLYYRHVEPQDIERMRMAAEEVAAEPEQPRPEAAVRAVSYLKQYGIYREAYAQVLLEMERELRAQQALEDDEIMLIMAAAL